MRPHIVPVSFGKAETPGVRVFYIRHIIRSHSSAASWQAERSRGLGHFRRTVDIGAHQAAAHGSGRLIPFDALRASETCDPELPSRYYDLKVNAE
jgi:hypothetical protein